MGNNTGCGDCRHASDCYQKVVYADVSYSMDVCYNERQDSGVFPEMPRAAASSRGAGHDVPLDGGGPSLGPPLVTPAFEEAYARGDARSRGKGGSGGGRGGGEEFSAAGDPDPSGGDDGAETESGAGYGESRGHVESSVVSAQDTTISASIGDGPSADQAQQVVKSFVRGIVKGRVISVLSTQGGTAECLVTLDRKLTTLSVQRAGKKDSKKRNVPLDKIAEIAVGEDVRDQVELEVDETCVTLLLDDGQAIGFTFPDLEARDTFALCLSMFVDGRRAEVERKRGRGTLL